jgi:hypothetical protein
MARPPILSGYRCYHCGSDQTSKAGMARGKQRFKCRGCSKFFREDPKLPSGDWDPRTRRKHDLPSASQLILELQSIAHHVLKKTPTTNDINELSKKGRSHSLATYYAVFGSFVTAIRRARLKQHYLQEFNEMQRKVLLDELRALSKRLKRPLLGKDVMAARKKKWVSPINHFQLAFGTVPNAIAIAKVAPKVKYSREELIAVMRKLDAKLDRPVEAKDIDELYHTCKGPSHRQFDRIFGGLEKARKAAGAKTGYKKAGTHTGYWQKYTQQELIAQLKALGKKLGKKPNLKDINTASKEGACASHTSFTSMFGSLPQAYHAAGFHEIEKNARKHTDKEIIASIKKLAKELGRFPGYHDLMAGSKAGKCPSPGTIVRRIGKLTEIRERFVHPTAA